MQGQQVEIMYQNGTSAGDFVKYNKAKNTIDIFTDSTSPNALDEQKMVIRACDRMNRLTELNINVNVKANSAPTWNKQVNFPGTIPPYEVFTFELPTYTDRENNTKIEVLIKKNGELDFPGDIMKLLPPTNQKPWRIQIHPASRSYSGKVFHFILVLKEVDSDVIETTQAITFKVAIDP